MAADHVHHLAWPDWEERGRESSVAEAYRILDASLGELLKRRRRGDERPGRLRPRRRLAPGRRQPERAGSPSRGTSPTPRAARPTAAARDRLFELRRKLPKEWRYSVKQRLPVAARAGLPAAGAERGRLEPHARLRLRDLREHRPQRRGPRAGRHRRARRGVRAAARGAARAAARPALARRRADRRRGAPARGSLRRAAAGQDSGPGGRVPRLRVARQGQPDRADTDLRGRDRDPRAPRPALRRRPPPGRDLRPRRARTRAGAPSWRAQGSRTSRRR